MKSCLEGVQEQIVKLKQPYVSNKLFLALYDCYRVSAVAKIGSQKSPDNVRLRRRNVLIRSVIGSFRR
jgi:hypothetical protein